MIGHQQLIKTITGNGIRISNIFILFKKRIEKYFRKRIEHLFFREKNILYIRIPLINPTERVLEAFFQLLSILFRLSGSLYILDNNIKTHFVDFNNPYNSNR